MRHLAWAGVAVGVVLAAAASCVPDFQFRPEDNGAGAGGSAAGTGGAGGAGGAGGQGGTTISTSNSGGSGGGTGGGTGGEAPAPTVPCGPTSTTMECQGGEICCYHTEDETCDKCSPSACSDASCGSNGNYAFFSCNAKADCAEPMNCCMTYTEILGSYVLGGSQCQAACSGTQFTLCDTDEDCPGTPCGGEIYPGYRVCD